MKKLDFKSNLIQSIELKKKIYKDIVLKEKELKKIIQIITKCLIKGGKLMFCGNGGSASDAQHLATEFLIRLKPNLNRSSIPAISLTLDSSVLTACGNDYGFENVFSRTLESLGNKKDVLIAISTSGNSKNIINVLKKAKKKKIFTIGFLGYKGGISKKYCGLPFVVKSNIVARIQETHIFLGHLILEAVEKNLIEQKHISLIK